MRILFLFALILMLCSCASKHEQAAIEFAALSGIENAEILSTEPVKLEYLEGFQEMVIEHARRYYMKKAASTPDSVEYYLKKDEMTLALYADVGKIAYPEPIEKVTLKDNFFFMDANGKLITFPWKELEYIRSNPPKHIYE